MAKIQSNNTGISGEYFVAAELLRRGFQVGITMGNAKAIDLFAQKDGKEFSIQVKAIFKKQNGGWPMKPDKVSKDVYYVFVNLNADAMGAPEYFVAKGSEVRPCIKAYKTRAILNRYSLNNEKFLDRWDKFK